MTHRFTVRHDGRKLDECIFEATEEQAVALCRCLNHFAVYCDGMGLTGDIGRVEDVVPQVEAPVTVASQSEGDALMAFFKGSN
jgi:hypothetical protein